MTAMFLWMPWAISSTPEALPPIQQAAGAERSAAHSLSRPQTPVCQAHDKKIFPAKAEIPNHQQVVIWDFCFYYGSINQISESGLLNLYARIDLSEK